MNELRQSLQGEGGYFAFLKGPSVARWAAMPLPRIVGYGFMEHGFAKLSQGPEAFAVRAGLRERQFRRFERQQSMWLFDCGHTRALLRD